jgi:hypothetical protein
LLWQYRCTFFSFLKVNPEMAFDPVEPILREVFSALSQASYRIVSRQDGMLVERNDKANRQYPYVRGLIMLRKKETDAA